MSKYDNLLRKKEQETSLDESKREMHWAAMAGLLNTLPPSTAPYGTGKIISLLKVVLVISSVSILAYLGYKQLTKSKKEFNGILKPSNIKSQFFTINPAQDEIIRTSHASIFKIKKGTFKTDSPVSIEIKEVFTPDEILLSGLTTLSDSKPLRSNGMFYFNASSNGKNIEPLIPVDVFVPSKDKDTDMQLFRGEIQSDSTINWKEPKPIVDTMNPKDLEHHLSWGRQLFMGKCASCHSIFQPGTGPGLRNLQLRGPWKNPANIRRWINNPPKFMATDKYTQNLKSQYVSMMPGFPDLTDTDITGLLAYINYTTLEEINSAAVTIQDSLTFLADTTGKSDCGSDTTYYSVQNNFEEYDTTGFAEVLSDTTNTIDIEDTEYRGIYKQGYDFEITNNGWYNIDAFLKTERTDTEEVKLTAEIINGEELPFNAYVFVPTKRVLQPYSSKKGNNYSFIFENGKIPLPLRYRAIIFAFGSSGKKILYGATEFTIQKEQLIKVTIQETTEEGLLNVLNTHNINGVKIDAIEKEMNIIPVPCEERPVADTGKVKRVAAATPK